METAILKPRWSPLIRTRYLPKNCIQCDAEFFSYPSSKRKLCSNPCRSKYVAIRDKNMPPHPVGDKHYNWKGGLTTLNQAERQKFANGLQRKVLIRDNYTCQICNKHGGLLQVDHIKKWSEFPELRFIESNCRTLCMACHYFVTFKKVLPKGIIWGHNLKRRTV